MGGLKRLAHDKVADHWTLDSGELAPYVFTVIAQARDGRRIEATGSDEERLRKEVVASIRDSDAQMEQVTHADKASG